MRKNRRIWLTAVVAALAVVAVAFAIGKLTQPSSLNAAPAFATSAPAGDYAVDAQVMPEAAPAWGSSTSAVTARQIIITGSVSMSVDSPVDAAVQVQDLVDAAGGRIDGRSEYSWDPDLPNSITLTVRISNDAVDGFVQAVQNLGKTNSASTSSYDATLESIDLQARINSLQSSIDQLNSLKTQATTLADLITIEGELASRQSELDSLQSQYNYLSDQVELATLTVDLSPTAASATPGNFWDAVVRGWKSLVATVGDGFLGLGFALPWILAIGLVVAAIWLVVRRRRRRHPVVLPVQTSSADPQG